MAGLITYTFRCGSCQREFELELDPEAVSRWQRGELVQRAFPHLSDDQRELLVSRTCEPCFDEMGKEDE